MKSVSRKRYPSGIAVLLGLSGLFEASATPVAFVGSDVGAHSLATMPNSEAACNAWNIAAGALGTVGLVDFEAPASYPSGPVSSLLIAPGVTMSVDFGIFTISNLMPSAPGYEFNTTVGGSFYAALDSTSVLPPIPLHYPVYTFTFNVPVQAFGLYVTGRGQYNINYSLFESPLMSFNDGTQETIPLSQPFFSGASGQFVGFTDAGAAISSVTVTPGFSSYPNLSDTFGFDDIRSVPTPEPGSLGLMLAGLAPLAARRVRQRKAVCKS